MDGVLLYGAQKSDKIDKWLKADNANSRIRKNSKKNKQVKEHR
jgi:hypothetical protein